MKPLQDFIQLMTKVLDFLPRYLELSEQRTLTSEESDELENIIKNIDIFNEEIVSIIPELNISLTEDMIKSYFSTLHSVNTASSVFSDNNKPSDKFSRIFKISFDDWLITAQN